jgi:hypothetical protein
MWYWPFKDVEDSSPLRTAFSKQRLWGNLPDITKYLLVTG